MKSGFVYLVGAGPGDPGLLTVKAMKLLNLADVVIYDYLADESIVKNLVCEKIYAGKQGGDHTLKQDEINSLIIQKAKEGKTVVRLKGGDPFIFGRGGEEAEELVAEGIPFQVVPGISSFYSAPAYAGIPFTHRDFANAFEVVTGHRRDDSDSDDDVNFPEFNPDKTFAFLMGMKNFEHIKQKLINEKNFPSETHVAVISWGTRPEQKVVTGTLDNIAEKTAEAGLLPPAIIVMGGVVTLREKLKWFDTLPLFGKRIAVTRTRKQSSKLAEKLSELGARVIEFPTIEISPVEDMSMLDESLRKMNDYSWIIFTSQNAVEIFFERLFLNALDSRSLAGCKIASIGPATANELMKHGIRSDMVPKEFIAESLLDEMKSLGLSGEKILIPCSSDARNVLSDGLKSAGADVDRIIIYSPALPADISETEKLKVTDADIVTFTSSSTANNYYKIFGGIKGIAASIGPVTSSSIRELMKQPEIEASVYTIDGLVDAIVEYCRK